MWMEKFMAEAERARSRGESSVAIMVLRRLKVYKFTQKIQAPTDQIPQCAACFASFVPEGEAAFQQR